MITSRNWVDEVEGQRKEWQWILPEITRILPEAVSQWTLKAQSRGETTPQHVSSADVEL